MARVENKVTINKPVEKVFAFIADGMNNRKWRPGVLNIKLAEGKPGETGAIYHQELRGPGGRRIKGDYKLTEVKPNERLSFAVVAGPARPEGHYILVPSSKGTQVTFRLHNEPKGFLAKLMDGMVAKTMQSEVLHLAKLKEVLEKSE